jgi:solute carrier family 6 GABA transporter-like protein 1
LGTLPGGIHWVRLLFFDLFLLGIDSAFAFLEGILTVTSDTEYFKDTAKWKMTGAYCLISFLLSIMYCTDAGLNWLDAIDYYINFVMTLVGFFETFGAGWVYGIDEQIKSVGYKAGTCNTVVRNQSGE